MAIAIRRAMQAEADEEQQKDEEVERALDVELGPLISDIAKTFKHSSGFVKSKDHVMKERMMQAMLDEQVTRDPRNVRWNQRQENVRQNDIMSCMLEDAFQKSSWVNTLLQKDLNKEIF